MIDTLTKIIGDKDAARIATSFVVVLTLFAMVVISGSLLFGR